MSSAPPASFNSLAAALNALKLVIRGRYPFFSVLVSPYFITGRPGSGILVTVTEPIKRKVLTSNIIPAALAAKPLGFCGIPHVWRRRIMDAAISSAPRLKMRVALSISCCVAPASSIARSTVKYSSSAAFIISLPSTVPKVRASSISAPTCRM